MALNTVKTFFSEHHQGYISPLQIMSFPIVPQRDPDISEEDKQRFADILALSASSQPACVVFYGVSSDRINQDKASLLAQASLKLERQVCLLQCAELVSQFIGETEKHLNRIIAEAESRDWILFFDEADALFSTRSNPKLSSNKIERHSLEQTAKEILDIVLKHNGLLILSISEKDVLSALKTRLKDVIMLN